MTTDQFKFDDGAGYERYMGKWSQLVGESFLAWLNAESGLRWLDVGCGNGAFTEIFAERCAPVSIHGIDPSEEQLAFARTRAALRASKFLKADAMSLPFSNNSFDAAVMPLVIFFVPNPSVGVSEMARVVSPGGIVTAYGWDILGGGFPYETLQAEMRAMGVTVPLPPNPGASQMETLRSLWSGAGLENVETTQIHVERTFDSFEDYWSTIQLGPSIRPKLAVMKSDEIAELKNRMHRRLATDSKGRITYNARANAVKGRVRK